MSLTIIIIDKAGLAKTLNVKEYKECDLYKKCGFKQPEGFEKRVEWNNMTVFGKINGKANMVNKYEFPEPLNNELFFGSCAVVCKDANLSLELWETFIKEIALSPPQIKVEVKPVTKSVPKEVTKSVPKEVKEVISDEEEVDLSSEDIGSELSEEEYV